MVISGKWSTDLFLNFLRSQLSAIWFALFPGKVAARPAYRSTPIAAGDSMIFPTQLAAILGTNEALILQKFHEWLEYNQWSQKMDHFIDGRWWTYNTYAEWQSKHFTWLSVSTIKRICKKLEGAGILVTGRYAKSATDQTKWYSIDYQKLSAKLSGGVSKRVPSAAQKSPIGGSKESHDSKREATKKSSNPQKKNHQHQQGARAKTDDGVDDKQHDSGDEHFAQGTPEGHQPIRENNAHESSAPKHPLPVPQGFPLPYEATQLYERGLSLEVWSAYVAKYGEAACLKAADNALRNGYKPPALFRDTLDKGQFQLQPVTGKTAEFYEQNDESPTRDEIETEIQRRTAKPEAVTESEHAKVWRSAFAQLEVQLDRVNFDTWLRDAEFVDYVDETFVIGVRNNYARDMLTHRLNRAVQRVVSDVVGTEAALRFEVKRPKAEAAEDEMPLFKLAANPRLYKLRQMTDEELTLALNAPVVG